MKSFFRSLTTEFIGTAVLMAAVSAANLAALHLWPSSSGAVLAANSAATFVLLMVLTRSGARLGDAHLNPLVTVATLWRDGESRDTLRSRAALFLLAQSAGAVVGALLVYEMFIPARGALNAAAEPSWGDLRSEGFAAAVTVLLCWQAPRSRQRALVAIFSGLVYWCSSSSCFGNPAAVLARIDAQGPMGVAPGNALAIIGVQLLGGLIGGLIAKLLPVRARVSTSKTKQ